MRPAHQFPDEVVALRGSVVSSHLTASGIKPIKYIAEVRAKFIRKDVLTAIGGQP